MNTILSALTLLCLPQDDEKFAFKDLNFECKAPRGARRVKAPNPRITLLFGDAEEHTYMVIATEQSVDLDSWLEAVEAQHRERFAKKKELIHEQRTVGKEAAVFLKLEILINGVQGIWFEAVFVHQGIAYRAVAFAMEDSKTFQADFEAWLESFRFLEDRKKWLEDLEGKPTRVALGGGLLTFDLNRPRWQEVTFDQPVDYGCLDEATFQLLSGGAWVYVRMRDTRRDVAAELEDLTHRYLGRLKNSKATPIQSGETQCVEIVGEWQGVRRVFRVAAFVREDVAVEVLLEYVFTRDDVARVDWDRLLAGIRLQSRSSPESPPVFSSRTYGGGRKPDPGLDAFLPKARKILSTSEDRSLLGVSPDGATAVVLFENRLFVQDVASGKMRLLPDAWTRIPMVAWSRDGARIATCSVEDGIVVVDLSTLKTTTIDAPAFHVSFGPGESELLICTRTTNPDNEIQSGKVERVRLPGGERSVFLEFPLSRIELVTVSPDRKRVALVCNRDYPRTARFGGHLYVCDSDGTRLRQLTRDPEAFAALAWSADGKSLFASRRRQAGEDGSVGWGGPQDAWRISVEDGAAVNLTRSGFIQRLWAVPAGLVVEIGDTWSLHPSQVGTFCIDPAELERATSGRPEPKVFDAKAAGAALAARVREISGEVREFVPTADALARIADAFAAAAKELCGVELDFSRESLERLNDLRYRLPIHDPALLLGIGACYGETIRRSVGAEWKIKPVPFGEWTPSCDLPHNPLVQVVVPFTDVLASSLDSETTGMWTQEGFEQREQGQQIILVYPSSHAEAAARETAGEDYFKARALLDEGKVKEALDILVKELQRLPRNQALARLVISVCEAAEMPDAVLNLTRRAVEAGNEVPDLLMRYADDLAKTDPAKALPYYRKACASSWPSVEMLIRVGKAHATAGEAALAESCWRRAWRNADEEEKKELRKLLRLPEPETE